MKLIFNPTWIASNEWCPEDVGIKHRSYSMPVLAAALYAGIDLSEAYKYAETYLRWATKGAASMLQNHNASVENLEALCVEVGPEAAMLFHQELHRAFIEGRLRQSAFQ